VELLPEDEPQRQKFSLKILDEKNEKQSGRR